MWRVYLALFSIGVAVFGINLVLWPFFLVVRPTIMLQLSFIPLLAFGLVHLSLATLRGSRPR